MLFKGCSSIAQLQQISIFQDLAIAQLESLARCSHVKEYQQDEIVMHEGDRLRATTPCFNYRKTRN